MIKLTLAVLILGASVALAAPHLTVVYEYTAGSDGSRRNLHVFRVEDPRTHQELKSALTQKELELGVSLVAKRKPPSQKNAGQKLYEINLFDLATRRYIGN